MLIHVHVYDDIARYEREDKERSIYTFSGPNQSSEKDSVHGRSSPAEAVKRSKTMKSCVLSSLEAFVTNAQEVLRTARNYAKGCIHVYLVN